MKSTMRAITVAAFAAMVSAGAFAALSPEYANFAKGPAQWIMTKEEVATWKTISNDADAKAFIDLFWARRDPTPGTPVNEYRDSFNARVQYADDHFTTSKIKGSLSDRGQVLIVVGPPTRVQRANPVGSSTIQTPSGPPAIGESQIKGDTAAISNRQLWVYDRSKLPELKITGPVLEFAFTDQFGEENWKLERSYRIEPGGVMREMIARSIVSPNLTVAPTYQTAAAPAAPAAAPAPTVAATPAAPVNATTFKTAALQTAVNEFRSATTNPYAKSLFVTWGEFVTPAGDYFVPVELYVPKSGGLAATGDLTFFGVVEDASGKPVAVFEEPAKLTASKNDLFFDKSLSLPAGKFRGTFGLAQNGTPLALASTEMTLAGSLDKSAPAVSNVILSNNVYPLSAAQNANDPFAFGGLKVVPKADKTFSKSDDLWYFVEVRNPGVAEGQKPMLETKLDIDGVAADGKKVAMSFPPEEASLIELKGVPGHYGIGNSFELNQSSFKPGNYTLKLKVTDKVTKQSYTVQDNFRITG